MAAVSTRWSLVLSAGEGGLEALNELCGTYWFVVYAYLRRQGYNPQDAAEHTQEFFTQMLRRNDLSRVRREGGRFRSWLFTSVKHYHLKQVDRKNTLKRKHIEVADSEEKLRQQAAPGLNPEQTFERQWALAVIENTTKKLQKRYKKAGKLPLFEALSPLLTQASAPYRAIALELQMSEGAVKTAAFRLRKQFGEGLREEVSETLDGPEAINEELRNLMKVLSAV